MAPGLASPKCQGTGSSPGTFRSYSQRPLDPASLFSGEPPALGSHGPWLYPSATETSPRTATALQLPKPGCSPPTSRPAPTPDPRLQPHSPAGQQPRPCSQPGQELALPISRLTLDLGPSALTTFYCRAQLYAPVGQCQPQGPSRPCS